MIYHMEVSILSRGKGRSLGASLSYISGEKIHDSYSGKTTIIAEPIWCNARCIILRTPPRSLRISSTSVMSSTRWKSGKTPVPDACSSVLCQTNSCQASGHESSMSSFRRTLYLRVFVRWLPSTEESYHRIIRKAIPTSTLLFQHGRWGRRGSIPRKTVSTTNGPTLKYGVGLGLGYKTGHTRGATSKSASVTKAYESKGSRENPPATLATLTCREANGSDVFKQKSLPVNLPGWSRIVNCPARRLKPTPADRKGHTGNHIFSLRR